MSGEEGLHTAYRATRVQLVRVPQALRQAGHGQVGDERIPVIPLLGLSHCKEQKRAHTVSVQGEQI